MPFTQEYSSQYHVFEILWDSSGYKTWKVFFFKEFS